MPLKIERLTLYKHGLGFFERAGQAETSFTLEFPRRAMDDVLKSLTVIPEGATVHGIAFETPPDRNPNAQRQALEFAEQAPVSGLIAAFTGRRAVVSVGDRRIEGELIGLEREDEQHLERALLAVFSGAGVELVPLAQVTRVSLLDEGAQGDLAFALESKRRDEERSHARVSLSAPSQVDLSYIAPAPAWRVSYRVLVGPVDDGNTEAREVFVQGWGVFDNTLEEDLEDVQLTLTAGMPVSFRYNLHEPNTPERPLVQDDSRVLSAPMAFDAMAGAATMGDMAAAMPAAAPAPGAPMLKRARAERSAASLSESAPTQASGEARGALFAYKIATPVSVRRGESGMVPILTVNTRGERELLYSPRKNPDHPASSVRFKNASLTLERGPATVLERGEYAGEAIVPFTPGGSEVILASALELGLTLTPRTQHREETVSVRVQDGSLFIGVTEFIETTYHAASQLEDDCTLTLEHPRQYDATLETAALEANAYEARFKFRVPKRSNAEFIVTEKRVQYRYQDIRGLQGYMLEQYLDEKLLERSTFDALSTVLEHQARIATLNAEIQKREIERQKVRSRLEDTRKNLEPLDATRDSKLRERFIRQLETLEDGMNALEAADRQDALEIQGLEKAMADTLLVLSNAG